MILLEFNTDEETGLFFLTILTLLFCKSFQRLPPT